jgi:hypothetical protein
MTYKQFERMVRILEAGHFDGLGDYVANELELALSGASNQTRECLEPCLPHLRDAVELNCPPPTSEEAEELGYGVRLAPGWVFIAAANRKCGLSGSIELPDAEEMPDLSDIAPAYLWGAVSTLIDDVAAAQAASRPFPHVAALPKALLMRMGATGLRNLREWTSHLRKHRCNVDRTPLAMAIVGVAGTIGKLSAGGLIMLPA